MAQSEQPNVMAEAEDVSKPDSKSVFVVHGRNMAIRNAMFSFLRAMKLEPIEWGQAVARTKKGTPYTGEILDAALAPAQAIIVILTPDDEARLRAPFLKGDDPRYERELTPQARPNVLFEAGLALGGAPDRTIVVEIGLLRPFSDLLGRHTIRFDNSPEVRQELVQRLRTAGCDVDVSGTDWLSVGDFDFEDSPESVAEPPVDSKLDDEVDEIELSILKYLADTSSKYRTPELLAGTLELHEQRIQYYLDRLRTLNYVDGGFSSLDPRYELKQKGRALLVERDLI